MWGASSALVVVGHYFALTSTVGKQVFVITVMVITLLAGGQSVKEWWGANLHGDVVIPGVALASRRTPLKTHGAARADE